MVLAHDASLLPVLDFFPKLTSQWQRQGWEADEGRWRFVADWANGVEEGSQL